MARDLDITLLRAFVAVADHASMTKASNVLSLTQGAVSQRVSRLEELSGPLFVRGHRCLRLNATGERLLDHARRLLALNDDLWLAMRRAPDPARVRLGAPHDLVGAWLTPILREFTLVHPEVDVALTCLVSPDLSRAVEDGLLDLAVVEEPIGPTRGTRLTVDRLVWVEARDGTAQRRTPLPVSLIAEGCAFRPLVFEALGARGVPWRAIYEGGSMDATKAAVRAGLSVTTLLAATVPDDLSILGSDAGLPELPALAVNLHRTRGSPNDATVELERLIRRRAPQWRAAA